MPRRLVISIIASAWTLAAPASALADGIQAKGLRPARISFGQEIRIADYIVAGMTTVFDFYSDFCPTCRALAPGLEKLHATRDDIAVVLVNINRPGVKGIDWKSPVAKQFDLPLVGTPQFKVYGPDGRLKAEGKRAYELVTGWLN
jgi:thiol-disulfide isomerase/thioredoxin